MKHKKDSKWTPVWCIAAIILLILAALSSCTKTNQSVTDDVKMSSAYLVTVYNDRVELQNSAMCCPDAIKRDSIVVFEYYRHDAPVVSVTPHRFTEDTFSDGMFNRFYYVIKVKLEQP